MTGRRGRRRRKLLDDLKERRGYCELKQEALEPTVWRAGFGRVFGPVVRHTAKLNEYIYICIYTPSNNILYMFAPVPMAARSKA